MPLPSVWSRPSFIRDYIRTLFPEGEFPHPREVGRYFGYHDAARFRALVSLLHGLDPAAILEGLTSQRDRTVWAVATSAIEYALECWTHGADPAKVGVQRIQPALPQSLLPWPDAHPLLLLHDLLDRVPESPTPPVLQTLGFLPGDLAMNVARDIASLDALLRHEQWKAAAVIGGSIVEALLLALLEKHFGTPKESFQYASARKWMHKRSNSPKAIDEWGLELFINAAIDKSVGLLTPGSEDEHACRAVQKYRNLIHPGVERAAEPADEGAALFAVGAVKRLLTKFA